MGGLVLQEGLGVGYKHTLGFASEVTFLSGLPSYSPNNSECTGRAAPSYGSRRKNAGNDPLLPSRVEGILLFFVLVPDLFSFRCFRALVSKRRTRPENIIKELSPGYVGRRLQKPGSVIWTSDTLINSWVRLFFVSCSRTKAYMVSHGRASG